MPLYDFDAAREEEQEAQDPPRIRFAGKIFEFPASEPATVRLERASRRTLLRDAGYDPDDIEALEAAVDAPDELRKKLTESNDRELNFQLGGHVQELLDLGAGSPDMVRLVNILETHWTAEGSDPNSVRQEVRNARKSRGRKDRPTVIQGTGGGSSKGSSSTGRSSNRTSGESTASG